VVKTRRRERAGGSLRGDLCYDSWSLGHLGYLYPGTTPVMIQRLMSRWSSGYLLDYEPRGSGSIPEVRNLEICILRIPSLVLNLVKDEMPLMSSYSKNVQESQKV